MKGNPKVEEVLSDHPHSLHQCPNRVGMFPSLFHCLGPCITRTPLAKGAEHEILRTPVASSLSFAWDWMRSSCGRFAGVVCRW